MKTMVSDCCGTDFKVAGEGETHWHECVNCGCPCDIESRKKWEAGEKLITALAADYIDGYKRDDLGESPDF